MFSKIFDNSASKKNFCFLFVLALLGWFIIVNPDIAFMFFAAVAFTCALVPLVDRLSKKMNRALAATIVLLGTILVLCVFTIPIFILGAYQIIDFIENFPKYIQNLDNSLMAIPFFKAMHISLDTSEIMSSFAASSTEMINSIVDFVKSASSAFLYIFTSVVFMFFFLADKDIISKGFLKFFPVEIRQKASDITDTILEKLGGYVVAQFIVSASVWIVMTLGLLIFHINYALILGLIAGVLSIIPVLGSALSLVICLIATYESGIWALVIVTVMFTLSHFVENNVVRPWVYSKFLNLHPVIIFLALFVGAKYAGVLGVIFAPPIAMALYILLDELYLKKMN
ncbi:MAG: AI-2E family transporter [bacterium]|nr:AI-2E family transporter [bacterium]